MIDYEMVLDSKLEEFSLEKIYDPTRWTATVVRWRLQPCLALIPSFFLFFSFWWDKDLKSSTP
jgi:hypothetical protein